MASPLKTGKQAVDLASAGPRVSRIRRDPPPVVQEKEVNLDEVDRRDAVVGVIAFALAICVIVLAFSSYSGWSPAQYTIKVKMDN